MYVNRFRPPVAKHRYATVPTGGNVGRSVWSVGGTAGVGATCGHAVKPAHKINGHPIAFDSASNRIVRYQVAATRSEADEVIALLPSIVSNELAAELRAGKEAYRYDLLAKCAYCFQSDGDCLHIWSWNEVDDYLEAGSLLSLIVLLEKELSEELASEIYLRATGRNVYQPRLKRRENSPDRLDM